MNNFSSSDVNNWSCYTLMSMLFHPEIFYRFEPTTADFQQINKAPT